MLSWTEREDAQKNAAGPVLKAPAAQASCEAPFGGNDRRVKPANDDQFSDPPLTDTKAIATIAAQLAIAGYELHVVRKDHRQYYEVRRRGQARTCSTVHDLRGVLAQIGGPS